MLTIAYDQLIGSGAVANVYRGRFVENPGGAPKDVAVKVLRKRTQQNK